MSASQPSSESDRGTSQQEQPRELRNGKEPPGGITPEAEGTSQQGQPKVGWMTEDEWNHIVNSDDDHLQLVSAVCIFKVPNLLKESEESATLTQRVSLSPYKPKKVFLGSYHHTSAEFTLMIKHKRKAVRRMMTRFNKCNRNLNKDPNNMEFCSRARDEIMQLEKEIQESYEEDIEWDEQSIARMCLDGCFILEILRTLGGEFEKENECYEHIFKKEKIDYTGLHILQDILKLENQIPVIVLRKLLQLELNNCDNLDAKLFRVLLKNPCDKFYPFRKEKENMSEWTWPPEQVYHLLGLLRSLIVSAPSATHQIIPGTKCGSAACIIVNGEKDLHIKCISSCCAGCEDNDKETEDFPRAVELRNAGIKFTPCNGGIKNIRFDQNSATILITDYTEVVFRNLIAFEMCKPFDTNYVACYVKLMDDLIDSEEDVALLRRMNIITNYVGSNGEVAQLFNGLCKGVTVSLEDVFDNLKRKVNAHYRSKSKVHIAELVEHYFSSPWKAAACGGAILGLLLSLLQTIFLIISVYK